MKKQEIKRIISVLLTATTITAQAELFVVGNSSNALAFTREANDKEYIKVDTPKDKLIKERNEKLEELEQQRKAEEERIRKEQEELARLEAERLEKERLEQERKNKVGVNLDNLLEPSNIKAEELYEVFMLMDKPEMAQLSWALVDSEYYTGLNCIFMAGLVAQESAWNTSYRAVNQNNVTGFSVYNSNARGSYFNSKYDCIVQTAEWIKKEYLSPNGVYFMGGYTSYHVNLKYCFNEAGTEPDMNWSKSINNISKTIQSYYHKYVKN